MIKTVLRHTAAGAGSKGLFARFVAVVCEHTNENGAGDDGPDLLNRPSGAVSNNIPAPGEGIWRTLFGNWSTDSIVHARSAPPVNVVTGADPFPYTVGFGPYSAQRPDLVGGPGWIFKSERRWRRVIRTAARS